MTGPPGLKRCGGHTRQHEPIPNGTRALVARALGGIAATGVLQGHKRFSGPGRHLQQPPNPRTDAAQTGPKPVAHVATVVATLRAHPMPFAHPQPRGVTAATADLSRSELETETDRCLNERTYRRLPGSFMTALPPARGSETTHGFRRTARVA